MKNDFSAHFVEVGPEDIILIKMSGKIDSGKDLEKFENFSDELDKTIEDAYKRTSKRVNLLLDVKRVSVSSSYSLDTFKILEKSARRTNKYDNKTAVLGADYAIELLVDAISALSAHGDIKFFQTKEEAIEWLKE